MINSTICKELRIARKMRKMDKIKIVGVAANVYTHKGFADKGCYASCCTDNCCRRGCDMDKETYELILLHREKIEKKLGFSLELCFENEWSGQVDFLGQNSISTTVLNGICSFHVTNGKGCVLWQMVFESNCSKRIVPSTCRLYPITWNDGVLQVVDAIEQECNCVDQGNCTCANLWDTQREAIEDIFSISSQSDH